MDDPEAQQPTFSTSSISQIPLLGFPFPQHNLEVETTDTLSPVAGHVCVEYKGCMLCWGGYCYDERDILYRDCNWLYIFPYALLGARSNVWFKVRCQTDLNLRPNSGSTAGIYQDQLYIFGGCIFDDNHRRMINTSMLLAIDLCNGRLVRKRYPPGSRIPTPRDKTNSWILDDKFYIFGGYGMSWHRLDHGQNQYFFSAHDFLDDDMGSCWNNQLLFYDLKNECWNEVKQSGTRPSARAASACAHATELNLVFLFGGRHDQTRLNDLFVLDLSKMVWTQIDISSPPEPTLHHELPPLRPEGRSWCTFTLLSDQKKILLFGGLDSTGRPLSDLWELDISEYYNSAYALFGSTIDEQTKKIPPNRRLPKHCWRQIPPLDHQLPPRLWHGAVLMGSESILYYGGLNEAPSRDSPFVRSLLCRRLCPPSLRHSCFGALASDIVRWWSNEMAARKMAGNPQSEAGSLGRRMNSYSDSDLLAFASQALLPLLPHSLHAHLRLLLTVRKHAKSLNLIGGGNTPRGSASPVAPHWNHTLIQQFHLLNLLDGRNEETDENEANESSLPSVPSQHRSVPPSPKILKRSLAMEMIEQICVLGRDQSHSLPLLQSLFKAIDFV